MSFCAATSAAFFTKASATVIATWAANGEHAGACRGVVIFAGSGAHAAKWFGNGSGFAVCGAGRLLKALAIARGADGKGRFGVPK